MKIKLIATDLDGTFLGNDHETIPQENIVAFEKAHKMGAIIVVASGRTKVLTDDIIKQIPFADYLITSNGACTYDLKTNELIFSELMDNNQTLEIFKVLDKFGLPYEIYYDGDCFIDKENYKQYTPQNIPAVFFKVLGSKLKVIDSLPKKIENNPVEKINIMRVTPECRLDLIRAIHSTGEIHTASAIPVNMEVNSVNANKGYAIKKLSQKLNIERQEIMAFGDGENDCEMLEFAGISFAMGNGSDYAKNSAKFIADDSDKCGVAKAVLEYALGE